MPHQNSLDLVLAAERLKQLARDWKDVTASERAVFHAWLIRFCEALGVEPPVPPTERYRFELPVHIIDRDGRESVNYIDCWKADHFALEVKASGAGASPLGERDDTLLRRAFGQVRNDVAHVSGDAPPYLMVMHVSRLLVAWDRWSGAYGDYAAGRRIPLAPHFATERDLVVRHFETLAPMGEVTRDADGRYQADRKVA